ncbi:hypothetical protein H2202_003376 [Exophiala xenobiotica]|nr:hypothetical protein H2202_003376 [Exophiala xenobiotica]KAK5206269.1 hypothetical protein LTR41_008139 [Exophiala xenobiotica]KAK5321222.1 hypothetical protein LTR93_006465 [Exophiala xenobiotica]
MALPDTSIVSSHVVVEDGASLVAPVASGCERHRIPSDSPKPCPFRLFKINGHAPDGNLDLTRLEGEPCHKLKEYAALSYAWEGQTPDRIVYCNGQQAFITDSLQAFLALLLEKYGPNNFYWADQLCVSQVGSSDKERQVPLMDTYFSGAQEVLIWLGESTPLTDLCCDMMDDVIKIVCEPLTYPDGLEQRYYFPGALGYPPEVEDRFWQGLYELCTREWWRRVWTAQEFVLAKRAIFHCGSKSGNILQVRRALDRERYEVPLFGSVKYDLLVAVNILAAGALPEWAQRNPGSEKDLPTWHLMNMSRQRESTQKVDKVFGLLSISSAAARDSLKVQYEGEGYKTTWIRWAHIGIQENEGYELLISRPWLRDPHLPSWCPNLDSPISYVIPFWRFQTDVRLKLKGKFSGYPFPLAVTVDKRGLICKGLLVDTVKEVVKCGKGEEAIHARDIERLGYRSVDDSTKHEMRVSGSFVARSWVLAHESSDESERAWIDFLRTITYDGIDHLEKSPPTDAEFGQAFLEFEKEGGRTQEENRSKTRNISGIINYVCARKSFFTTETGMMGLGPLDIEAGDLVCIFPGVGMPLILRRASEDLLGNTIQLIQLEAGKEHIGCIFLGGAFVQGIMWGEIFEPREERGIQAQIFTIY